MEPSPSRRGDFHRKLAWAIRPYADIDWDDPAQWGEPDIIPVYFQPGPDEELPSEYIVYEVDGDWVHRADNGPYAMFDRYQVTFVRQDPDSPVMRRLSAIQHSSFSRHYATSGLNHDVYVIYHP